MAIVRKAHSGGAITLTTTGSALTSGSTVASAGDVDLTALTPANYPHIKFALTITFATSTGIENKVVELIARPLNIDGTSDADVPTSTFRHKIVGTFRLKNVTSAQLIECEVFDADPAATYYLYQESGQASSANWTLKATPFTHENV